MANRDLPLYIKVALVNREDDNCRYIRDTLEENLSRVFEAINLRYYSTYNNALFYRNRLWVLVVPELRTDLIRESHNQPIYGHPGRNRTLKLVGR